MNQLIEQSYTIIAENDESKWEDKTGVQYHFPKRYLRYLKPGTQVIYYKGKMKNASYRNHRLSVEPHYFGIAKIGNIYPETKAKSKNYYAEIIDFSRFGKAVPFVHNGNYLETIPNSRLTNYWRDAARPIDKGIYDKIIDLSDLSLSNTQNMLNDNEQGSDEALTSSEGKEINRYTTTYERKPELREQAIRIHGLSCMACGFNFEKIYGEWGKGFIHVHHAKPIATSGIRKVNARDDLIVLCANCHAMVHRKKHQVLTLQQVKEMLNC